MNTLPKVSAIHKPATFAPGASIPFVWGAQDAAAGKPCVPEMQWVRRNDQRDYAAGFAFVAGHSDTTRYFLGSI